MGQVLTDTLPMDAGNQKFMGPVDPSVAEFVIQRAANVETVSEKDYGDAGVSQGARQGATVQTHDSAEVTTTESVGTEVTSGGYSRAGIFVDVGAGADVRVTLYGRLASAGDNYLQDLIVDGQQGNTRAVYIVAVAAPYLAIGLQAVADSATCSCSVYLLP